MNVQVRPLKIVPESILTDCLITIANGGAKQDDSTATGAADRRGSEASDSLAPLTALANGGTGTSAGTESKSKSAAPSAIYLHPRTGRLKRVWIAPSSDNEIEGLNVVGPVIELSLNPTQPIPISIPSSFPMTNGVHFCELRVIAIPDSMLIALPLQPNQQQQQATPVFAP
jgi:hypothetical protein